MKSETPHWKYFFTEIGWWSWIWSCLHSRTCLYLVFVSQRTRPRQSYENHLILMPSVGNNKLESIPPEIVLLQNLCELSLGNNLLVSISRRLPEGESQRMLILYLLFSSDIYQEKYYVCENSTLYPYFQTLSSRYPKTIPLSQVDRLSDQSLPHRSLKYAAGLPWHRLRNMTTKIYLFESQLIWTFPRT